MILYGNLLGIRRHGISILVLRAGYSNRIFARGNSGQINNSVRIIIIFVICFIRSLDLHLEIHVRNQLSGLPVNELDFKVLFHRSHVQAYLNIGIIILFVILLRFLHRLREIRRFLFRLMRIRNSHESTFPCYIEL